MSVDPRTGTVQRARFAFPLEMLGGLQTIRVRPVSIIELDTLTEEDAAEIGRVLRGMRLSLRGAARGAPRILLATPTEPQLGKAHT
jgi:hypothetical protein